MVLLGAVVEWLALRMIVPCTFSLSLPADGVCTAKPWCSVIFRLSSLARPTFFTTSSIATLTYSIILRPRDYNTMYHFADLTFSFNRYLVSKFAIALSLVSTIIHGWYTREGLRSRQHKLFCCRQSLELGWLWIPEDARHWEGTGRWSSTFQNMLN